MMPHPPPPLVYDVAILGGGLAGAATALLLLQRHPALRVVLCDRGTGSRAGLGEALPELTAFFLGRVLGLGAHLNECHFTRQGSRFWFAGGDPAQAFDASSEIGPRYLARLPTYLADRAVLDEEIRRRAVALGAELRRPATVTQVARSPDGGQTLTLDSGETVRARWAVDASGRPGLTGPLRPAPGPGAEHPLRLAWGRWRGVADWDGAALRRRYPQWAGAAYGMRNPAINYLAGDGWWSGWTPLRGGEVSIRTVGDPRRADVPGGAGELKAFLEARHPVAREMLRGVKFVEGSGGAQSEAAVQCDPGAGEGCVRVGGAAGFIDPLYGGHLDWTACGIMAAADRIDGREHRANFPGAAAAWFDAVLRDKYEYLGEFDLMRVAFLFDLGLYTLRVARAPYREGAGTLVEPPFARLGGLPRLLNGRLAQIARARRARGGLGRANSGRRALFTSFNFNRASGSPLLGAAARWLWLELTEGWRTP